MSLLPGDNPRRSSLQVVDVRDLEKHCPQRWMTRIGTFHVGVVIYARNIAPLKPEGRN
jgi:hypothetical protein